MTIIKQLSLSLPAIIIAVTIFILSHGPQPGLPKLGIEWEDKILHVIAYFIFGLSLVLFMVANFPSSDKKYIIIAVLTVGSLYAMSDEIHQYFIPGRYAEFFDWVADVVGIYLSTLLIKSLKNKIGV